MAKKKRKKKLKKKKKRVIVPIGHKTSRGVHRVRVIIEQV